MVKQNINPDWIVNEAKGLVHKRDILSSPVCVVITNDAKREVELIDFTLMNGITAKLVEKGNGKEVLEPNNENVYLFRDWDGLSRLHKGRNAEKIELPMPDMSVIEQPTSYGCLAHYIEKELMDKPTTLIISGMIAPDVNLNRALNTWAVDERILEMQSTIIVILPSKAVKVGEHPVDLIPEAILNKCNILEVVPSTQEERIAKIHEVVRDADYTDSEIKHIADILSGLDLNQTEASLVECLLRHQKLDVNFLSKSKGEIVSRGKNFKIMMNGKMGFEAVGGYQHLKDFVQRTIIRKLENFKGASRYGARKPKGCLTFGQPATGKTLVAECLANELGLPIVIASAETFSSKWYGESEAKTKEFIKFIESISPCVLFIDEIDAIGRSREGNQDHEATRKAMSEFMSWMASDHDCIIWATTNRPEDIDNAFKREGRFDNIIPQLLPDVEARKEILKVHLNVRNPKMHTLTEDELMDIARMTHLWNGAELQNLTTLAVDIVFNRCIDEGYDVNEGEIIPITHKEMVEAVSIKKVDTNTRQEVEDGYLKLAEKYVNDRTFLDGLKAEAKMDKPMSRLEQAEAKMKAKEGKKV